MGRGGGGGGAKMRIKGRLFSLLLDGDPREYKGLNKLSIMGPESQTPYIAIWSLRVWRLGSWGLRVEVRVQDLGEGLGSRA